MTFDDDEGPDRPVPARRRAEQRWRMSEPWRVQQRRRRRLRIGAILVVVVAVAIVITALTPTPAISSRDSVAVAGAGSSYRVLFYGCHGERLVAVTLYAGDPPTSGVPFTTGALWLIEAGAGGGVTGRQQLALGQAPAGYRVVVPFQGLPASANHFTILVQTSAQQVRFRFDQSLVSGSSVVTATGLFPLSSYEHDEAAVCS